MHTSSHGSPDVGPSRPAPGLSRRAFTAGAIAAAGVPLLGVPSAVAATSRRRVPDDFGSVSTAPRLPAGFTDMFESRFVHANGIRQHVVIGGDGPPLLLVHGWPENWYAWRFVMPTLARSYTVIAVDQRGIGLSEKPRGGYDAATLGSDLAALMTELGHRRFAVVGHDTGYIISYALAADHRDRVERLVLAEIPGPPGVGRPEDAVPLFLPDALNNRLWHILFNRVDDEVIIDMVQSNAAGFYGYEYSIQAGPAKLPDYATRYYVRLYTRDRNALRATFGLYRAWEATQTQNGERQKSKLTIPVLGVGGGNSWGPLAAQGIAPAATDVQTAVIPGAGHWVAEQAPVELLAALTDFLAPYGAHAASR